MIDSPRGDEKQRRRRGEAGQELAEIEAEHAVSGYRGSPSCPARTIRDRGPGGGPRRPPLAGQAAASVRRAELRDFFVGGQVVGAIGVEPVDHHAAPSRSAVRPTQAPIVP
jgi:hypothetical protein